MSDKQPDNITGYNQSLITPAQNREMFNNISRRYDLLNRIMSAGLDRKWRRLAVDQLHVVSGGEYIDAGCGTGDLCIEIIGRIQGGQIQVTGIDHSDAMLGKGMQKIVALAAGNSVTLMRGDAVNLPFKDSTVNGVVSGFVIRNICDRNKALVEWHRVIRPGGRCVVLELAVPENPVALLLYKLVTRFLVPAAGALFSKYKAYVYLIDSIRAFPPPDVFAEMLESAGFRDVRSESLTFGAVRIYSGIKVS